VGTEDQRTQAVGILAAVLAYVAWGFLSPGGKLLLDYAGPWTINFHRTWLSLLVFILLMGPRRSQRALAALGRDVQLWILGVGGLGLTFVLYLYSVDRLDPSVATVMLYLAPFLIAWAAHRFLGERRDPWVLPTALVTLAGVAMAVVEPIQGQQVPMGEVVGVVIGAGSVLGWAFYTVHLRFLSGHHPESVLTIAPFAASCVFFLVGGLLVEGLAFEVTRQSLLILAVYVAFPSVASFVLYTVAVRRAGATVAGVLLGVELLATAAVSAALGQEQFGIDKLIGYAIVLVTVTVFLLSRRRRIRQGGP
jgi:drug/metabolite transporter (DMT)-like permease